MLRKSVYVLLIMVCSALPHPGYSEVVSPASDALTQGQAVYDKACKWCHGSEGDGDGPAAFFHQPYSGPRPRDFTIANYRFRSTPTGYLPTNQDLFRTISHGIPGFMPSFSALTSEERWSVIQYIQTFHSEGADGGAVPVTIRDSSIPSSLPSIERGRSIYFMFDCQSCHGDDGRGQENATHAGELLDDHGLPILPNDLTNRYALKNGSSSRDIVRTLMTGLNGTPMPSYASQFESQPDDLWHLANYVLSLSAGH